jgi:hypothetical protein
MLKQSKELEASSFSLIASLPPDAMKPKDEASNSFDWFNLGQKE